MKTTVFCLMSAVALSLSACHVPVDQAPPNTRAVVEPGGSTNRTKSWSTPTKDEGDAVLGAFGGTNGTR